jgi:hypothetical protein
VEDKMNRIATISAMTILLMMASVEASAAKKKRSDYTKAQQKAIYEQVLKACRKKFGARLQEVKINYATGQIGCIVYDA